MGYDRMVISQITSTSLGQSPICVLGFTMGKDSSMSHNKVKKGLFREESLHRQSVGPLGRQEKHQGVGWSVFIGASSYIG